MIGRYRSRAFIHISRRLPNFVTLGGWRVIVTDQVPPVLQ